MRDRIRTACWFLATGAAHLLAAPLASSQDWPQWRGPNRDGVVHGVKAPDKWPKALKAAWKVSVGVTDGSATWWKIDAMWP